MNLLKASYFIFLLGIFLQGCESMSYYREATNIKHRSVKSCLSVIERKSGSEINTYQENTPLRVAGRLKNGQSFTCYFMLTGTDGGYYQDEWTALPTPRTEGKQPLPLDGSTMFIVTEGGYCNVSDDCVSGLYCSENKCVNGRKP